MRLRARLSTVRLICLLSKTRGLRAVFTPREYPAVRLVVESKGLLDQIWLSFGSSKVSSARFLTCSAGIEISQRLFRPSVTRRKFAPRRIDLRLPTRSGAMIKISIATAISASCLRRRIDLAALASAKSRAGRSRRTATRPVVFESLEALAGF